MSFAGGAVTAVVAIGALALVGGFGISTMKSASGDTPVVLAYVSSPQSSANRHYATIKCIIDGNALKDGQANAYVDNVFDLLDEPPTIKLAPDAEYTTLSRARRLVHDRPATHAPDPKCVAAGGFDGERAPLIYSLF